MPSLSPQLLLTRHSPGHCPSQALSRTAATCSLLFWVISLEHNPDHTSPKNSLVALLSFKDKILPVSSEPRKIPKFNSAKLRMYTNVGQIPTLCTWNIIQYVNYTSLEKKQQGPNAQSSHSEILRNQRSCPRSQRSFAKSPLLTLQCLCFFFSAVLPVPS